MTGSENVGNSTSGVGTGGGTIRSGLGPVVYPVVDRMISGLMGAASPSVRSGRGARFVLGRSMFSFGISPGARRLTGGRRCWFAAAAPPSVVGVRGVVKLLDAPGKSALTGGAMT